jgi:hypothetical protein
MTSFSQEQRRAQTAYIARFPNSILMPGWAYRFDRAEFQQNLNPMIRDSLLDHFDRAMIQWHQHCNHALSSQVCCVNFLGPLMHRPEHLSRIIADALGIAPPQMLPVGQGRDGADIFVDFEWIGLSNYLGEWPKNGKASRGANATSADAVVRMTDADGAITTILIEWKYTESYGAPLRPAGNPTRIRRYKDKAFAPDGPIRADHGLTVEDFFWEPFYQLLRQQMLAWRMERAREDDATRVIVLHLSPAGNQTLHKVTAQSLRAFGENVFTVFSNFLADPSRFHATTIESAFTPTLKDIVASDPADPWAAYLLDRYTFLGEQSA